MLSPGEKCPSAVGQEGGIVRYVRYVVVLPGFRQGVLPEASGRRCNFRCQAGRRTGQQLMVWLSQALPVPPPLPRFGSVSRFEKWIHNQPPGILACGGVRNSSSMVCFVILAIAVAPHKTSSPLSLSLRSRSSPGVQLLTKVFSGVRGGSPGANKTRPLYTNSKIF